MTENFKVLDEQKLSKVNKICDNLKEKQLIYESSKFYEAGLVYILKVKYGYSEIIVNAFKKKGFNVRKWGNDDFCIDVSRPKALEEVVEECFDI